MQLRRDWPEMDKIEMGMGSSFIPSSPPAYVNVSYTTHSHMHIQQPSRRRRFPYICWEMPTVQRLPHQSISRAGGGRAITKVLEQRPPRARPLRLHRLRPQRPAAGRRFSESQVHNGAASTLSTSMQRPAESLRRS